MTGVDAAAVDRLVGTITAEHAPIMLSRHGDKCLCGWTGHPHYAHVAHNVADDLGPLLQAQHDGEDVRAAVEAVLSDPYCEASTWTISRIRAALSSPAPAERDAP